MRILTVIVALLLLVNLSRSEILEPETYGDALDIINKSKDKTIALIFLDPTDINSVSCKDNVNDDEFKSVCNDEKGSSGFFGSLISSVSGIFSSKKQSIGDILYDLGEEGTVIKIDTTNPELNRLLDDYNVLNIPNIVVLKEGEIIYEGQDKPVISLAPKEEEEVIIPDVEVNISPGKDSFKEAKSDDGLFFSLDEKPLPESSISNDITSEEKVTEIEKEEKPSPKKAAPVTPVDSVEDSAASQKRVPFRPSSSGRVPTTLYSRNRTSNYVPTVVGYRANDQQYDQIDQKWKNILKEEESLVDEIKKIYDDDKKLSDSLKESEEEIHESEELFYKAKNAIDKTLMESENQMKEYERELDRLYRARQSAIKARDDLYHPYPTNLIPTQGGYVQQRMAGPYKTIKRRPAGPPPESVNFHDMLDTTESKSEKASASPDSN